MCMCFYMCMYVCVGVPFNVFFYMLLNDLQLFFSVLNVYCIL